MFAVVRAGSKEYEVSKGSLIQTEKIEGKAGDKIEFKDIILLERDGEIVWGKGIPTGATVLGAIERQGRKKKIIVFKYKRRKGYKKKIGHRQCYTTIRIMDILTEGEG